MGSHDECGSGSATLDLGFGELRVELWPLSCCSCIMASLEEAEAQG